MYLKLLRVIASVDPRTGGPVESVRQFALAMGPLGVTTEVVSLDPPDAAYLVDQPLKVHALGRPGQQTRYGYTPQLIAWLKRAVGRFDAVIVDGLWQFNGLATWLALRGTTLPYFIYPHGMLDPWFRDAYRFKHLKKAVYWTAIEQHVVRNARGLLFTTAEEMRLAPQPFWPYVCRALLAPIGTTVPDVDLTEAARAFLAAYPAIKNRRVVLFLGRIDAKKGGDLLIAAFAAHVARHPSLLLVMAGPVEPAYRNVLQQQAERLGIGQRICWTGMLSGQLKWGAFAMADLFALPSHQENFGIAVAEALACGVPVVISNKVNLWRDIEADGVGWVGDDTVAGTEKALSTWLTTDLPDLTSLRAKARQSFANRYDMRRQAPLLLETLRGAISGRNLPERTPWIGRPLRLR